MNIRSFFFHARIGSRRCGLAGRVWPGVLAAVACLALASPAVAVEERDVAVRVTMVTPADAANFTTHVSLQAGPLGSQYLDATITNRSDRSVALAGATVSFPWEGGLSAAAGDLVATGGACMFRTPTFVHEPGQKPLVSGAFLLSRRAGGGDRRHALVAFLTWRTFWSRLTWRAGRLTVTADGEQRIVRAGETLRLERLWLAAGDDWQALLFAYGDEIARENKIVRREWPRYVGWSTWDYYGGKFTYEQILGNMKALAALDVGANLVQIDGGWWTRKGDYLSTRADIPGGMKGLADKIHRAGLVAGLHIDAMRADRNAVIAQQHPEYFLKDQRGELIAAPTSSDGSRRDRLYFDFSHPGARDYMRRVLHVMRREWGYTYFKLDFLKFGFPELVLEDAKLSPKTTRIVPHDPALTSVERFQLAMRAFREGMGEDAYFLACSAEFGPTFGHVDAQRTGGDIDPQMHRFSRATLENGGNFYLHPKVVLHDADYHVVRAKEDEDGTMTRDPRKTGGAMSADQARMWTHYTGLFSWPKISGDNLMILRDERKAFFREAVNLPHCERFVPLDFWAHARHRDDPFSVFLGEARGRTWLAVFNWSADAAREIVIEGGDAADLAGWRKASGSADTVVNGSTLRITLPAHASAAYELGATSDFDRLRRTMRVEQRLAEGKREPALAR